MFDIIDRNGKKELFRWFQAVNKPMKVSVIPEEVQTLSGYAYNNQSVGQVDLIWMPDSIDEIPMYAFRNCTARAIRMSPNIKVIRERAFAKMPNLLYLYIPEGCKLGIKRYDGVWINQESVFEDSPKYQSKFQTWIDSGIEYDLVTVLWQSDDPTAVLLQSYDLKEWKVVPEGGKGVYQYPVDGVRRVFKVGVPNTKQTARAQGAYTGKSRSIVIK